MIKRKKKTKLVYTSGINITPLMDVLTVLLFFLIKSMSVTSVSLTTPDGIRLPASYIETQAEEAVVVSISSKHILVNRKEVVSIGDKGYNQRDIASDGRTLKPLQKILADRYKERLQLYEGVENFDKNNIPVPKLLIQADKDLSFGLMKYLLHTVALVGYTDYQFIVVPKD